MCGKITKDLLHKNFMGLSKNETIFESFRTYQKLDEPGILIFSRLQKKRQIRLLRKLRRKQMRK